MVVVLILLLLCTTSSGWNPTVCSRNYLSDKPLRCYACKSEDAFIRHDSSDSEIYSCESNLGFVTTCDVGEACETTFKRG
ncbi:unnamed protein product, partial [Notodromas monacha]